MLRLEGDEMGKRVGYYEVFIVLVVIAFCFFPNWVFTPLFFFELLVLIFIHALEADQELEVKEYNEQIAGDKEWRSLHGDTVDDE